MTYFVTLKTLSEKINLPEEYLQKLVDENGIPFLCIENTKVFDVDRVGNALSEIADGNMLYYKYGRMGFNNK